MNNPLISVLVPVYNSEKYLAKCLDSIINQTYKNLEIILVNDGSTDKSGTVCDEYAKKDSRIKVLHQENNGISYSRNVCLKHATGDYIGFVDSDDFIAPDMYKEMLATATKTDSDMVICNFVNKAHDTEEKEEHLSMPFKEGEISVTDYIDKVSGKYAGLLSIVWNKLYKRHLFEGIQYPDGRIHEDEATIHRICHVCNKIYYLPKVYYTYNYNHSSIMNKDFSTARLGSTDAILDRIHFLEANGYSKNIIHNCKIFLISDFIESIRNLNGKSKSDRKEIKEKAKSVKPYCKELLKSDMTDSATKKAIRILLISPFLFFHI